MKRMSARTVIVVTVVLLLHTTRCFGYSVLTHEAIIDANWNSVLVPLLKQKYPAATDEELKNAHAFAYGGCVMPDLGYYPFGSRLFTNLVHYVRSGDFIENLFKEASNINEYAFAIGTLCHYYADKYGHSVGVNRSVPLIYPEMKTKFGDTVTYADDKISHLRTEFSFDVLQTARGNYAPQAYHDFIGFQVSKELIEKAFLKTYGLDVNELFGNFDRAVGSFRWAVKELIPSATRAAWKTRRDEIRQLSPAVARRSYVYNIRRQKYFKEFGRDRDKATFRESVLAFVIRIAPKWGPLKILKFRIPGEEAQKMFLKSFDETVVNYRHEVSRATNDQIALSNIDWDTGKKTMQGEYSLADKTYADWLMKLKEKKFETISSSMKRNILAFYKNYPASNPDEEQWQQTSAALEELKNGR
jgi:Zinc dependent phospholipase C